MIVEIKHIRNTVKVKSYKREIKNKSRAAIRRYNYKPDIDLIERFNLYLDLCQIIGRREVLIQWINEPRMIESCEFRVYY